jgi:hypothetical protein
MKLPGNYQEVSPSHTPTSPAGRLSPSFSPWQASSFLSCTSAHMHSAMSMHTASTRYQLHRITCMEASGKQLGAGAGGGWCGGGGGGGQTGVQHGGEETAYLSGMLGKVQQSPAR